MIDICDLDLVGRKLEQNGLVINITKEYYQQQVIAASEARELLTKCAIANLVGQNIVGQALELKMAKEAGVKKISGVPFLMIFKFQNS